MTYKTKWYWKALEKLILTVMTLYSVAPVYMIVSNSFRKTLDIKKMPPDIVFTPIFTHFEKILALDNFGKYFLNSLVVALSTTFLVIVFGTFGAYGIRLFKSKLGQALSNIMLLGKLVPAITILIPLYVMLNRAGLTGSYAGPILAHAASTLPFATWLIASFIRDIPVELFEMSTVLGYTRLKTLFLVVFPLITPAIASAAILVMQFSWNELLYSLQLTNMNTYTLTVGIARYAGAVSVEWGKCSAAATITILPIVLAGFFMQKYLVTGLTAGAVKG
jgi:ABC-type glycerol-3-phosphate transport system permease component